MLRKLLAGWRQDIPAQWREILGKTRLSWTAGILDREMEPGEMILPGRKTSAVAGAAKHAHIFRAFENTDPAHVRALLLGQDPYPKPAWATGRAFEQGNLEAWPEEPHKVADSLRRIVQAMISSRTGNLSYTFGDRGWREMIHDVQSGSILLDPPREFFDHLERQGVMFLNTSLTVSAMPKARESYGHFDLWAPLISRVLSFIGTRQSGQALFLLFGRYAENVFDRLGPAAAAKKARTWRIRADVVRHCHPAAITKDGPAFLQPPNPFTTANELLQRIGSEPIYW